MHVHGQLLSYRLHTTSAFFEQPEAYEGTDELTGPSVGAAYDVSGFLGEPELCRGGPELLNRQPEPRHFGTTEIDCKSRLLSKPGDSHVGLSHVCMYELH